MLKMEDWLVIRDYNSQNLNISKIARRTGHDRKTVRKYLNKRAPEPLKRPIRQSKLDFFKPYILKKLSEYP